MIRQISSTTQGVGSGYYSHTDGFSNNNGIPSQTLGGTRTGAGESNVMILAILLLFLFFLSMGGLGN